MRPTSFLERVARPNMVDALERPDDVRAIVNAILTLDALAGVLYEHGKAEGIAEIATYKGDDKYRDALAEVSHSYRVLRDAAAAIKHGGLDRERAKVRLLYGPEALRLVPNSTGIFRIGDALGSEVVVIEFDPGPGYTRASSAVADSYRMLARIVEGKPPSIDEHDDRRGMADEEILTQLG